MGTLQSQTDNDMSALFTIPEAPKTEAQHAYEAALQIDGLGRQLLETMQREYSRMFALFWRNPNASPQAMAEAFGTQAANLFARSSQLATFLLSQKEDILTEADYTPPQPVVINEDGTVTIG